MKWGSIAFSLLIIVGLACNKSAAPSKVINWSGNTFTENGYTLNWKSNDVTFAVGLKRQLIETFFIIYPKLVKEFNANSAKTVLFEIDTAYKGVAATSGTKVVYNPKWFENNPRDIDVVTHEVMHIVQSYPTYNPWWLVEGIADYVRFKYGVANAEGGWSLPAVTANHKYDNGYRITARFLVWCEHRKPGCVKAFDSALRSNTYNANLWKAILDKTIDDLWSEYLASPAI